MNLTLEEKFSRILKKVKGFWMLTNSRNKEKILILKVNHKALLFYNKKNSNLIHKKD